MAISATDSNFASLVYDSKGYVLVDFWAEWCGPCKQLSPVIDEVSEEMKGTISIHKLNIDESPESATKLGIRSIPTLVLFKDGKKLDVRVGSLSKTALIQWIKSNIDAQ